MYIVCGYRMWFMTTPVVQQFGFYNSYEEAWFRVQTLLQTQNPISTGFSQSYGNQQFVLWIHRLEFGDNEFNLNQPLSLSAPSFK